MQTIVSWLLALLAAGLAQADVPSEEDVAAVDERLDQVERRLTDGRLEEARALLEALAGELEGQPVAPLRAGALREHMRRIAFAEQVEPPDPLEQVTGEVVEHDARRGRITLRYDRDSPQHDSLLANLDPDDLDEKTLRSQREFVERFGGLRPRDFVAGGLTLTHPITFGGTYRVTARGRIESDGLTSLFSTPTLRVAIGGAEQILVSLGSVKSKLFGGFFFVPPRIQHFDGEEWKVLEQGDEPVLEKGDYTVEVEVSKGKVNCRVDGALVLKAANKTRQLGQFSLQNMPHLEELVVEGQMSGVWFDDLRAAALDELWGPFLERYDVATDLPAWLHVPPLDDLQLARPTLDGCPQQEDPRHAAPLAIVRTSVEARRFGEALEYLDSLRGGAADDADEEDDEDEAERKGKPGKPRIPVVGEPWLDYVTAFLQCESGAFEDAVETCERLLEHDGVPTSARVLRERAVGFGGDIPGACAALEALVAAEPDLAGPREELAALQLRDGRPRDARATLDRALLHGIPAEALTRTSAMLERADRGPDFARTFEMKTTHYHVRADVDGLCFLAGRVLEESLGMYDRILGRARGDARRQRYHVYLFSRNRLYLDYTKDLFQAEALGTAGLYSPQLKQLLIWNLPDTDAFIDTVRHEGFHQYLDTRLANPPVWFNEGLAEYFETSSRVGGRMQDGAPNDDHIDLLASSKTEWTPYRELFEGGRSTFYGKALLHYAQGWALFHHLLQSGRDEARAFDRLFESLAGGASHAEALAAAFDEDTLAGLDGAVKDHVKALAEELEQRRREEKQRRDKQRRR